MHFVIVLAKSTVFRALCNGFSGKSPNTSYRNAAVTEVRYVGRVCVRFSRIGAMSNMNYHINLKETLKKVAKKGWIILLLIVVFAGGARFF